MAPLVSATEQCCEQQESKPQKRSLILNKLNYHKGGDLNDLLEIVVCDEPGPGGAHHRYMCFWPSSTIGRIGTQDITFQKGGVQEEGVNGVSNEALLAIVRHRLECFMAGPYPCDETRDALENVIEAMQNLQARTKDRIERGVEGQQKA